ncbi:hypothetical protein CRENBAI_026031 [Crenichthys baileyi]|uniref:Mineralocorticoid receptor n=1 Tax=Crenichthys baileyi TaxID=28760 RepID=A0AAV9RZK5_9TELE
METKGYQSFFEGDNTENKWSQAPSTMEYSCSTEDSSLTSSDILMNVVNVNCSAGSQAADSKDNNTKKQEQPTVQLSQNQPFVLPHFSNTLHGLKQEMDSKELSKTVAESMGLYMNAAREADFAFNHHGGSTSPGKPYQVCGRSLEENQCGSKKSPKLKPFGFQQPGGTPRECTTGTSVSSASMLASSLSCSPQTSSCISSPGGSNNMVSSTTSPTCFGPLCSSVSSPGSQTLCAATLVNIKCRNSVTCSPVESSTVGSPPLISPLNVMRSPMSSPQSMSSVRSPPSCSTTCNIRSSVSSPTGGSCTAATNNSNTARLSISSPASGGPMTASSPQHPSSVGFPVSSPVGGLGLVQNDTNSPEAEGMTRDTDFKNFEFPKVEMVDGEVFSVGLDQMGMVKYIKNEPESDFRSMCLGRSKCNLSSTPLITQIKSEPNKNEGCMNQSPFGEPSPSLGVFPASETTYLSLRNNVDEYSLSGILGPPVSSVNRNYETDLFSNNVLSKGVKQESTDGSYYQENNSMSTSAIVGVNSGGHSFHYQIGAQGTMSFTRHDMRDSSNPLLNLISPVTALMESWKSRPGMSQGSLSARNEGFLGQNCIADSMSRGKVVRGDAGLKKTSTVNKGLAAANLHSCGVEWLALSAGQTARYSCNHSDAVPLAFLQMGKTAPLGVVETGSVLGTLWNTSPWGTRVEETGCSKSGVFIWTVASWEVHCYPFAWLCWKVAALWRRIQPVALEATHMAGAKAMLTGSLPPWS